jgi:hypothetical protein
MAASYRQTSSHQLDTVPRIPRVEHRRNFEDPKQIQRHAHDCVTVLYASILEEGIQSYFTLLFSLSKVSIPFTNLISIGALWLLILYKKGPQQSQSGSRN